MFFIELIGPWMIPRTQCIKNIHHRSLNYQWKQQVQSYKISMWSREIMDVGSRYIVILIKMHTALIIHCGLFGALVYVHFVSLDMNPTPVVVHSHSNDEFSEPGSVM